MRRNILQGVSLGVVMITTVLLWDSYTLFFIKKNPVMQPTQTVSLEVAKVEIEQKQTEERVMRAEPVHPVLFVDPETYTQHLEIGGNWRSKK